MTTDEQRDAIETFRREIIHGAHAACATVPEALARVERGLDDLLVTLGLTEPPAHGEG